MSNPFLDQPSPDFAEVERIIKGEQKPQRVHLVEIGIDAEVLQQLTERYLDASWIPLSGETFDDYYEQFVRLHYRLGYDLVCRWTGWLNHPTLDGLHSRHGADLPAYQDRREWVPESRGLISSWQDFEQFPWDQIAPEYRLFEAMARHLPEGMKITPMATMYTWVHTTLLGTEGLFYLLYDDPDLVSAVFQRFGQIVYDFYASMVDWEEVGAIWHADDLGYTTSTLISPEDLRGLVLPWFKRYAELAHAHGKTFWLHCCGNVYAPGIIDDLIKEVQLDAFHSFQDPILPIAEFQERYGRHLAALGGVDIDKLCRLDEASLRQYMRDILDRCMPQGRFIFGSGNTVTNYVPTDHYIWMLEESRMWQP